ncbi:hypothetical protein Ait01nite_008800 [Actinoplanes italicus]|uniref:Uncharacterized protein n=1 Tax=Actinoplanes italicus TaxID=113567 RepID=A0A2T0KLD4_9ACTN|nr:hypothetical protein [Actinoplanes italicus]PRX24438.1 hypothetical protein CLV67_102214 [Actinoplanes italicus]GIE27835.1 hypothetical protein Ait01nite_008800 [Actinoplanes italicus]
MTAEQNPRTCTPGRGYSAIDLRVDTDSSGHAVDVSSIGDANGAVAFAILRR